MVWIEEQMKKTSDSLWIWKPTILHKIKNLDLFYITVWIFNLLEHINILLLLCSIVAMVSNNILLNFEKKNLAHIKKMSTIEFPIREGTLITSVGFEPKLGLAWLGFGSSFWEKKLGSARNTFQKDRLSSARHILQKKLCSALFALLLKKLSYL